MKPIRSQVRLRLLTGLGVLLMTCALGGRGLQAQNPPRVRPPALKCLNGSPDDSESEDVGRAMAVDGLDNVIVVGEYEYGTARSLVVAKYGWSGRQLWIREYPGPAGSQTVARGVAVDSQNNIVVVGYSRSYNPYQSSLIVVKWDPNGNRLWERSLGAAAAGGHLHGVCVAVDNQDYIVAAGDRESYANSPLESAWVVMRWDRGGTPAAGWSQNGNPAPRAMLGPGGAEVHSIAVDSRRSIVVCGVLKGITRCFALMKWDEGGNSPWAGPILKAGNPYVSHEASGEASDVAIDAQDHIVAAGYLTQEGTGTDMAAGKWRPDGTQVWFRTLPNSESDSVEAITLDAENNPILAGLQSAPGQGSQFALLMLSGGSGAVLQTAPLVNGTANTDDAALAVAVDANGNIAAGGYVTNRSAGRDYYLAGYDRFLTPLWSKTYQGSWNEAAHADDVTYYDWQGDDFARAIAIDRYGLVSSCGQVFNEKVITSVVNTNHTDLAVTF